MIGTGYRTVLPVNWLQVILQKGGDYMNTIARVMELADERNLSLFKLSQLCDVSYSTLKNAEMRGSQLGVPTIERICVALGVTLSEFFAEPS